MASIRLVSLNVERQKHLDVILPFLRAHRPDVVCFQELVESDVSLFAQVLQCDTPLFVPVTREKELAGESVVHGNGIFSRFPMTNPRISYYSGNASRVPDSIEGETLTYTNANRMVLFCDVEKDGATFRVGTTHFTWTARGEVDDIQRKDMQALLRVLEKEEQFILCGDFNAPRGGEIFSELSERYKDTIPTHYKTSIDINLHYARNIDPEGLATKMVDGLFTTPQYVATDVELVSGVSDHCAVVATVSKL